MNGFLRLSLLVCLLLIEDSLSLTEVVKGTIRAGAGYSSYDDRVTDHVCFKYKSKYFSSIRNKVKIVKADSYSDFKDSLGIDGKISGSYDFFSASVEAAFDTNSHEKEYSLSLVNYVFYSEKVTLDFDTTGTESLTEVGKEMYNNANTCFKLACGDQYISSFYQGAALFTSLRIKFKQVEDKEKFSANAALDLNIANVAANLKKSYNSTKTSAVVSINAEQIGGTPTALNNIKLSSVLSCTMDTIAECLKTAENLMQYVSAFGNQISQGYNLEVLGHVEFDEIEYLNLHPTTGEVSEEIMRYRRLFEDKRKENEYYREHLISIYEKYPVKLDKTFKISVEDLLTKVKNNLLNLPHGSLVKCYTNVKSCKDIKTLLNQLTDITETDLKFLENIKYTFGFSDLYEFYNNGGVNIEIPWNIVFIKLKPEFYVSSIALTEQTAQFELHHTDAPDFSLYYNGTWHPEYTEYLGDYWNSSTPTKRSPHSSLARSPSDFYFYHFNIESNNV